MSVQKAYSDLFGDGGSSYNLFVSYSGKFKGYNSNVRMWGKNIKFNLSKNWINIDEEIKIGVFQSLLCKLFKEKKETVNIRLYHSFLKNVHLSVPKENSEGELLNSFRRVNQKFFSDLMDECNLKWGRKALRQFGSYDYGTDTITINPILKGKSHLLDYVMFHEMLHKKFKFRSSSGRNYHHTSEFRKHERAYPERKFLENELTLLNSTRKKYTNLSYWF